MSAMYHIVTDPEELEQLRQAAHRANSAIGVPSELLLSHEELFESQRRRRQLLGIPQDDRPALRELLIMRYPDEWQEVLREHGFEVK